MGSTTSLAAVIKKLPTPFKIVLTGEDTTLLYQAQQQLIAHYKQPTQQQTQLQPQPPDLIYFDAAKQDPAEIPQLAGAQSMFQTNQAKLWLVTNWHKNRSTNNKKSIIDHLTQTPDNVIFTIPTTLTAAQKKWFQTPVKKPTQTQTQTPFSHQPWQIQEFKLPAVFFQFLDAIKTKPLATTIQLLQQSLQQKNEWELHYLLSRQFRLLLATKTNAAVPVPPFAKKKLEFQASKFTTTQLIFALNQLFQIEFAFKSGQNKRPLGQEIDRLLLKLYDIGTD